MRKIIIILSIIYTPLMALSQNSKPSFDRVMEYYIFKSTSKELYNTPKNHAYVYSVGISFNEKGIIDTLYFSDKIDAKTKLVFNLNESKINIFKSIKIAYEEYANKVVLLTIYHYNREDKFIDYNSSFLTDLKNLYPKIPDKEIIIYNPFIFGYYKVN